MSVGYMETLSSISQFTQCNRDGLYLSAVGLLETIQCKAQGTKTHLVCKDHSLLRYKCMFCSH